MYLSKWVVYGALVLIAWQFASAFRQARRHERQLGLVLVMYLQMSDWSLALAKRIRQIHARPDEASWARADEAERNLTTWDRATREHAARLRASGIRYTEDILLDVISAKARYRMGTDDELDGMI